MGECDGNWVHDRVAISAAGQGRPEKGIGRGERAISPESAGDEWPVVASVAHLPVIIPNTNYRGRAGKEH